MGRLGCKVTAATVSLEMLDQHLGAFRWHLCFVACGQSVKVRVGKADVKFCLVKVLLLASKCQECFPLPEFS